MPPRILARAMLVVGAICLRSAARKQDYFCEYEVRGVGRRSLQVVFCQFDILSAFFRTHTNIPKPPIISTAGLSVAILTAVEVFTDSRMRYYLNTDFVLRTGLARSEMDIISEQTVAVVVR
jgi:hypothetical protein